MGNVQAEKMFTFLRGVCSDGWHPNTAKALGFAREMHKEQWRKGGEPYVVHPLTVTCDAVGMNLRDDVLLAMLLLHDVPEDAGVQIMDLPVSDEVKRAVECMTIRSATGQNKLEIKQHYYKNLESNEYSTLGKGFDRRHNLSTMVGVSSNASILKNCFETRFFLLPLLREAKFKWPIYANQLYTIRKSLSGFTDILAALIGVKIPDAEKLDDELMIKILSAKTDEDVAACKAELSDRFAY